MGCCWLWLVDEDGNNDRMFETRGGKHVKDMGPKTVNNVSTEHWSGTYVFPFLDVEDYYFDGATPVQWNSFSKLGKEGTIIGNQSFANFKAGAIPNSTFDVPDSKPTFGTCKQCGVDPECPMSECTE